MKLSLSGRLWESPKGYRINLPEHIRQAALTGYTGVELRYPLLPAMEDIPSIRKLLSANKIQAVFAFCAGLPIDDKSTADAQRVISIVKELGGTHVRIVIIKEEDFPSLKKLAGIAASSGVGLAVHFHTGTYCDSVDKTLKMLDFINDDNVCILFDPIHMVMAGEKDMAAAVGRIGSRIGLVNIQNFRQVPDDAPKSSRIYGKNWKPAAPDDPEGLDFKTIISLLKKNGYDGWLNVMCTTGEDEDPSAVAAHYRNVLAPMI